jgi:hypothetical protein
MSCISMKRSRVLREVHETAKAMRQSGAIDERTMREFDALTTQSANSLKSLTLEHAADREAFVRALLKPREPGRRLVAAGKRYRSGLARNRAAKGEKSPRQNRMKITLDIGRPLLKEARARARSERTTLHSLVERGLHLVLAGGRGRLFKLRDESVSGKGLHSDAVGRSWDELRASSERAQSAGVRSRTGRLRKARRP